MPTADDGYVSGYQQILLDLDTGELVFHCADWRLLANRSENPELWEQHHPGAYTPPHRQNWDKEWGGPVERLRNWRIDAWTTKPDDPHAFFPRPLLSAEEGQQFVDSLAPLAERMIAGMFAVDGTGDLDWSAAALHAARDIKGACDRQQLPPIVGEYTDLVDFADVVRAVPEIVDPAWIYATDDDLDQAAKHLGAARRFQRAGGQITYSEYARYHQENAELTVCGIRAWLYTYRVAAAANLRIVDAGKWYATRPAPITASTTDKGLAEVAEAEQIAAAAEGVRLVGLEAALRAAREVARDRVWDELGEVGRATAAAEATYKQLRAARTGLLTQVIGWGEGPRSTNGAELARQARISRAAITQLRDRLAAEDDEHHDLA